jgi:predicted transcriptional regulator
MTSRRRRAGRSIWSTSRRLCTAHLPLRLLDNCGRASPLVTEPAHSEPGPVPHEVATTIRDMAGRPRRLSVTLDAQHARKLAELAERTHTNEGRLARRLLSQALDVADGDTREAVALLDRIPGAFMRAQAGLRQARSGRTVEVDALIASGAMVRGRGDPLDLGAPLEPTKGAPLPTEELAAMRRPATRRPQRPDSRGTPAPRT